MKTFTGLPSALSLALLLGSASLAPASAQRYLSIPRYAPYQESHVVWANGQAYWSGPTDYVGGTYLSSGELKFDPHHYRSYADSTDPQDYSYVVFHPHRGPIGCVWRKRVVNTDFEFYHPYVLVCD